MAELMQDLSTWLDIELFTLLSHTFTLGDLTLIPIVIFITWWLIHRIAHFVAKRLQKSGATADTVQLVKRVLYVISLVILVFTLLELFNVPLTAFAFLSGAIAIGFGFGAQNIINNFISGWILMWERPIRIGDFLEVDGAKGTVEAINTRSTRIRRVDGVHLLIPNSKLLENTVVNWTLIDRLARTSVRVGVAYGSDCAKVAELIAQAVAAQDDILTDPQPAVIFDNFGDNALEFEVFFWVNATVERDLRRIRSNVRFAIDASFNQAGIVIAFPQRDVHIDGAITLNRSK